MNANDDIDIAAVRARFEATRNLRGEDGEESDGDELPCEDCMVDIRIDADCTAFEPGDVPLCHECEKARLRASAADVPALLERIDELTGKAKRGGAKRGS